LAFPVWHRACLVSTPGGKNLVTSSLLFILAAGLVLVIGLVAKVLDLRSRREGEVIAVRGVVSDALGGDPELFELPLTARVRVPLWRGSPVTIRVFGEVPSRQIERVALRQVRRAATDGLSVRARIKSRMSVAPSADGRAVRTTRSDSPGSPSCAGGAAAPR
jgi:hypothetical protein